MKENCMGCGAPPRPAVTWQHHVLTTKEPRIRESRFLHTGSRISMQLKLRTAAGALAQAKADWNKYYMQMKNQWWKVAIVLTRKSGKY